MKLKDIVKEYYGNDLDNLINKIPDQAIEIIDELIQMFDLKLNSTPPAYMRVIIFNNQDNLFLDRYNISLNIIETLEHHVKYAIRIVDYISNEGVITSKELLYTKTEDFNIFYDELSKFIEG